MGLSLGGIGSEGSEKQMHKDTQELMGNSLSQDNVLCVVSC